MAATAKQGLKKIRETRAVKGPAIEGEMGSLKTGLALERLAVLPVRTKLIVEFALLRILQNLIGLIDFFKIFFGFFIIRIKIRMIFSR